MRRHLTSLIAIVVVLAVAWSAGWFLLARWADRKSAETLTELADRGVDVGCDNRRVTGFPFSLHIECGPTTVVERITSTRADLAGMRGGANVLTPFTLRIGMTSPAHVDSTLLEGSADARWENAVLRVGVGMNGPKDFALDASKLAADVTGSRFLVRKVAAEAAQAALSPSDGGGSNVELAFADLRLSVADLDLPPVTGVAAVELSVPPRALVLGRLQAPITSRNINVALQSGGARLRMTGEGAVDAEGVVDADITVIIAGVEALPEFIAALPENWQKIANVIVGGLFIFGKPTTLDGQSASEFLLDIEHGTARVGPVEFEVPRVPI
jgi:hypothetical protein